MNLKELNNSPRVKLWIVFIAALAAFSLALSMCIGGRPASARTRTEPTRSTTSSFTDQGRVVTAKHKGCLNWEYEWHGRFPLVDQFTGKIMYIMGPDIDWCAGANQQKVTKRVFHYALDEGGYYYFDGSTKSCGSTGNFSMGCYDAWKYHWTVAGATDKRTPSVRFNVNADGGVVGTVYWDN